MGNRYGSIGMGMTEEPSLAQPRDVNRGPDRGCDPEDVPGKCNDWLCLASNCGDSRTTLRCQLSLGHAGSHQEALRYRGTLEDRLGAYNVIITWDGDDTHWDVEEEELA